MGKRLQFISCTLAAFLLWSCDNGTNNAQAISREAQAFLSGYNSQYEKLATAASEAQWKANTEIIEGDSLNAVAEQKAVEELAMFTGSKENIETARKFLKQKEYLGPVQLKQLNSILYLAGNNPGTVAEKVKERIKAESEQTQKLYGFQYMLNGEKVTTNRLDDILKSEHRPEKRLAAWNASKEVGKELKQGLITLRRLRNETVQALGYKDYFSYQVSEYGMETREMMDFLEKLMKELWPLYRELHTYMRYELARQYNEKEVPDYLPAHWLPNRWGQDWSANIKVKGLNIDSILRTKTPEWIVKEGEKLYTSLGFPSLPQSFWTKSSLYPYPADSTVKKNNHASAWHMDLNQDVRSLMSVESNAEWFETVNHELGHIYYYLSYSIPQVPIILRTGANRAFHEAIGSMMGMAAMQKPYLVSRGLVNADAQVDSINALLKEAMNAVVFIFFSSGTMSHFEKELYADNLSSDQWNKKWWALTKQYQGIVPPTERDEIYCDAATKTHINDDAAQYYDYALSYVLLYQIHNYIARNILHQDPRSTNYYGNKEIGKFLKKILESGATKDWKALLKETTGEELQAKAMIDYFEPLTQWLKEQNKGREYTLPKQMN